MQKPFRKSAAMWSAIALIAASHAHADKPSWAGGGKGHGRADDAPAFDSPSLDNDHGHGDRGGKRDDSREEGRHWQNDRNTSRYAEVRVHGYFNDRQRGYVREYYGEEFRRGHCPPGLAKKHNGCLPPGQARQWRLGYPLGRDIVYYDVPPSLVIQLGYPPEGHRYVRVASDILLIAVGSGMVVDAIEDIGR
jgi:hypothetical protein